MAAGEALVIVLLLPLGAVFTVSPLLHGLQMAALGLAGGAGWIAVLWRPARLPPGLILAPLPMFAALVVTSLLSPYPSLSWPATWVVAAYAGLFWLFAFQACHPDGRRNLVAVIGIVVILAVIWFLLSVLGAWREWLTMGFPLTSLPLRPAATGGLALIPTWFADLVVVGTPVVVASLWDRRARIAPVALAATALLAVMLTGTRSVLVILAAASLVAVLLAVRGRARGRMVSMAIAGVIVVGLAGGAVALASPRSLDEGRSSAYAGAVARIAEAPLIGTGPGTYGVKRMGDPVDATNHLAFPDAHNILLTTLAESGVVGLVGLIATVALLGWAVLGAWRAAGRERIVIAGALFGVAIFAAHGMVDVVFAIVGIIAVAIAVMSIAATTTEAASGLTMAPIRYLRTTVGISLVVAVIVTGSVIRTEAARSAASDADAMLEADPAGALDLASRATADAPDLVPAWWVRMLAADASGDSAGSMTAARRVAELEGFAQRWMTVAVLASRQGDRTTALDALKQARENRPVDPLVELNAVSLLGGAGDGAGAEAAARRLLEAQPDIEGIVRTGPPELSAPLAAVRADVARERLHAGDTSTALLIALSGEDRRLADESLADLATDAPDRAGWMSLVDGWFGDEAARATFEDAARTRPTAESVYWAWRLAGHACDVDDTAAWDRSVEIIGGYPPATPSRLFLAPDGFGGPLPGGYPHFIWRVDHPRRPYVGGTWVFDLGSPTCAVPPS